MAEINNIGDLKGNFDEITDLLNSIRAQGMLGSAGMDKILNNINSKLETLTDDDEVALMRASLTELRNSVESRHNLLVAKISEIENSFKELVNKNSDNLKSSEIKELFDIIATNLSVFSKEVISQKDTLTEITLRIEALRADDSQKKDILRNISVLKVDIEKLNNGFESIVLNVNESFKDVAQTLDRIDTTKEIQNVKKDIENIYLSSSALLSAIQVVDQKNEAIEQLLNTLVTRESFQSAQDKLELIIDKSDDLRKDIGFLASKNEMNDLTQKIDTSIGVIAGLKTVLVNANDESSKRILAQLNALDETVQHILSEDDFMRFRNELNALVREVTQSTNLMRGDLLETNSEIRNVISLLNSLDIKTNFQEIFNSVNNTETAVKNTINDIAGRITQAQELGTNRTISDINSNIKSLSDKMSDFESNMKTSASQNLSQILNTVNEVSATISALGNDLHNDNLGNMSIVDEKIHNLREQIDEVKNSLSGLNSENSDKILENIAGMYSKLDNLKYDLQQGNESNLGNIISTVNELSSYITNIFSQIKDSTTNEVEKISGFVSDLSGRIDGMNAQLSLATRESANDIRGGLSELSAKLENVFGSVDRASQETISTIISNIGNVNDKLEYVKNDIQGDVSYKIDSLREVINSVPQILNDSNITLERIVRENSDLSGLYDKISQISADIYNNFQTFENDLKRDYNENLDRLFSNIGQLNQKLDDLNNDVKESTQNSVYVIKNNLAELTNKLDGIYGSLDNHSQDMIASIVANISDINSKVSLANSDLRNELVYKLTNFESIVETLPNALKDVQATVGQEYFDKTSYSINEVLSNMKDVSSDLQFKFEKIENELKQSAQESANSFIHNFDSVTERLEYINRTIGETNQNSVQEIKNNLEDLNQKLINISQTLEGNSRDTVSAVVANISEVLNQLEYSTIKKEIYTSTAGIKTEINNLIQIVKETQESSDSEHREIAAQNAQSINELLNNIKVLSTNIDIQDSALKEKFESEILSIRELLVEFSDTTRDLTSNLRSDITDTLSEKISNLETIVARVAGNYDVSLFNMQEKIVEYLESMKLISESTDAKLTSSATEIKDVKDEIKCIFDELKTTTQANSSTFLDIYNTTADNFNELIAKMSVVEELANKEFPEVLTTGEFERKIETIFNIFDEYKVKLDDLNDKQELALLTERLFSVKNQLDLISTDIIDVVCEQSEKLSIELVPIKDAVNKIVDYNLPSTIEQVREQIEIASNDLKTLLKENSDEKSQNIINSIVSGFDSFAEKINTLEFGLNTARNSGLNELKAILSNIVDTIGNINAQVNIKHVDKSDLVIERIANIEMVVQDGTLQNNDAIRTSVSEIIGKIDECINLNNEKSSKIIELISSTSVLGTKIAELSGDLGLISGSISSISDEIHSNSENTVQKFDLLNSTIIENNGILQTEISRACNKIDELETNIDNNKSSITSEIARVSENVSEAQQTVVSRINELESNIENGRQSIREDISSAINQIDNVSNFTQSKLNEFGEKFENIESSSNLVNIEVNHSNQRLTTIIEKIENIEHDLELNSQDIKSDIKAHILPVLEKYTDFATNEKLTEVAGIVESVSSKMLEVDYAIKEQCVEQLNTVKSRVEEVIEKLYSNKNELIENNNNRFEYIQGEICHALLKFDEIVSEISNINALNSQLIKSEFATIFGEFKQITEKLELPDNTDYIVESMVPKFKDMEAGIIEVYTKGINECQENFNNIIEKLDSKSFEQTTKVLLEDLNHIFLNRIEDSTQELKDFVNAVADRNNNTINFEDFKSDLMGMFYDYEQKLEQQKSELEELFAQEPDNSKIDELPQIISNNLNGLFEEYHQKVVELVENSKNSSDVIEYSQNLLQTFENIKLDLSDKIFENNEELKISIRNQQELFEELKGEFVQKIEEINSLYSENISSLSEKIEQSVLPMSTDIEKVVDTLNSISDEIISAKTELIAKIASLASSIDTITSELFHEDFELINQKLDLLATNDPGISDIEMDIAEIKHLILKQNQDISNKDILNSFVGKLDSLDNLSNLEKLNKLAKLEEIINAQSEVKELLTTFDKKLETYKNSDTVNISNIIKKDIDELKSAVMAATWESSGISAKDLDDVKEFVGDKTAEINEKLAMQNTLLENLKSDVVTTVVSAINGVSFDSETEEIIEIIEDVENGIKNDINQTISNTTDTLNSTVKKSVDSVINTTITAIGEISFEDEKEEIIDAIEQNTDNIKDFVKDILRTSGTGNFVDSSITASVEELKKENKENSDNTINTIVSVFNQLSFEDEAQDIIDVVDERADKVIDIVKDSQIALEDKLENNYREHSADIQNLADLINKSDRNSSLDEIREELIDVRKNLVELRTGEEDSDYSYTLHDIETDIAKLRLVLNDMQNTVNSAELSELNKSINSIAASVEHIKMEMPSAEVFGIRSDIEKMTEDITSISVRTNKLILNSDETTNDVKDSLRQFRSVIEILEDRAKRLDSNRLTANLERKVDYLNNLAVSGAQSDKVINQSFLYLAEWIDSAGAKIEDISETLEELKTSRPDDSAVLDMLGKKFEDQQNRINSLEEKLEQLLEAMDSRENLQMTKKIANIDKQLTKLNKSIERLTSYVDEE